MRLPDFLRSALPFAHSSGKRIRKQKAVDRWPVYTFAFAKHHHHRWGFGHLALSRGQTNALELGGAVVIVVALFAAGALFISRAKAAREVAKDRSPSRDQGPWDRPPQPYVFAAPILSVADPGFSNDDIANGNRNRFPFDGLSFPFQNPVSMGDVPFSPAESMPGEMSGPETLPL